jgi:hypothetical protein
VESRERRAPESGERGAYVERVAVHCVLFIEFTCTSCVMSLNHVSCVIDDSAMHDNNLLSAMRHAPRASRLASFCSGGLGLGSSRPLAIAHKNR